MEDQQKTDNEFIGPMNHEDTMAFRVLRAIPIAEESEEIAAGTRKILQTLNELRAEDIESIVVCMRARAPEGFMMFSAMNGMVAQDAALASILVEMAALSGSPVASKVIQEINRLHTLRILVDKLLGGAGDAPDPAAPSSADHPPPDGKIH